MYSWAPLPIVDVFLLVEQPRQRLSRWSQALAPLDDASAPPVASVDAYYDPTSRQAIFGLRYDELALGADRLRYVAEVALLAEIGMIQPAELSEGDRQQFVDDRLAGCTVHVSGKRKVVDALFELVRRVRGQKAGTTPPALEATLLPRARPTIAPTVRARVETGDSLRVVAVRGMHDRPVSGLDLPPGTRLALGSVRQPAIPLAELARDAAASARVEPPGAGVANGVAGGERDVVPVAATPGRSGVSRPSSNELARASVRRASSGMRSPADARQAAEVADPRGEGEAMFDPQPPPPPGPGLIAPKAVAPGMISARYLRSGRWAPLRVGALSLKGAVLMAVALPRADDRIEVELAYAQHRALVRGSVAKVSTMKEVEISGATMFSVDFELDDSSQPQLTALLTAARAANVTIKPAPPRATRRYPVEWPVSLGTTRGVVRAHALDVSAEGMFVRPVHALSLDAHVTFSAVLDDSLPPVSGHARVIRNITEADANASGLSPGYGLAILEMADLERDRWSGFLCRAARRVTKRVLIAASPARLSELETGLVAGGYATIGGTAPNTIAQLVSAEARPLDAALIDATWLVTAGSTLWVESVFTSRGVPYVAVHGDATRARIAIDRLLAVV